MGLFIFGNERAEAHALYGCVLLKDLVSARMIWLRRDSIPVRRVIGYFLSTFMRADFCNQACYFAVKTSILVQS